MATFLEESEKEVQIDYLRINTISFGEKVVKICPVDPEIIGLRTIIKIERN